RKPIEAPSIDFAEPQSYTPKFLADKILNNRSSIEGERKLVTVLFADVANYTSISEKLDPEEVHQIMDGCFKILMDEIHRYEGTINQFTGDGVMALFGAPVAHEDHAQRACYAALSIQKAIGEYGEKIKKDCGVDFPMRIGLNSGPVIVGSIGDDLRMDYTAVGDTTNLAARMEGMARPGTILGTGNTHKLARDFFEFKSLGKVEVKGKEGLQEAFELIKTSEVETRIGASVAKGLTRFVGRKNSMGAFMEAYEKAKSGSGQVVGIVGEAGVGKSRLLLEFKNRLPQGEFAYLEGRCLHYGGSMAYLPILDILRSYFDIQEGDREYLVKKKMEEKILQLDESLKSILPPFQEILSLKVDEDAYLQLEPQQRKLKAFEAIRDLLVRESENKPIVLVVEDLQWIDKTSEEFLNYLIDWLANTHILLILLYRPEYTHQWGSKSFYIKIGVDQLTMKTSAELVQAILEGSEIVPELRELILNRTAGNPLFMEEYTHTLLENGSIQRKENQYVLSRKASDIQVPDTIQGIIAARMDRLEDTLKRTMQVASVIGRDFAFRILQTITGMREELKSHLLNLQGLEFIYEKSLFPELEYIFKHALTQEVAYNSLLLKRRKE
ncbi:MAG: adenylate/guanylate cyclase domain-containing protein, partial [Candidatus Binatia bacterium]